MSIRLRRGLAPQVSVVLPFRDAASTLGECLDSIGAQSFEHFELVAVDDGSEDDSAELIQHCAATDSRIRLIRRGRLGLVGALNLGVSLARSPLVARMDADDVMDSNRLGAQRQFMSRRPGLALAGCQVEMFPQSAIQAGNREYIRWQNECVTARQIADNLYVESPFAHPSVIFCREAFERVGGYRHGDFPEDYELWLRMAESGCKMAKQPRTLLRWRERPQRLSRTDPRYSRDAFDRLRALYLARDPRIQQASEIVIWGAGRKTRQRARHLIRHGIKPSTWIDIDPRKIGRALDQRPVQAPSSLLRHPRPFVLIYVTNHGARDQITRYLMSIGYRSGKNFLAVG